MNKTFELPEDLVAPGKDVESDMDVRKAFMALNDKERQIVGLSVIAGYSSKEIAHQLKMNANTVRSVQMRALDKMRKMLDKEER